MYGRDVTFALKKNILKPTHSMIQTARRKPKTILSKSNPVSPSKPLQVRHGKPIIVTGFFFFFPLQSIFFFKFHFFPCFDFKHLDVVSATLFFNLKYVGQANIQNASSHFKDQVKSTKLT